MKYVAVERRGHYLWITFDRPAKLNVLHPEDLPGLRDVIVNLDPDVTGLVFTVNSFSGQKFTEVAKAYCRLIDAASGEELVRFDLTSAEPQTGVMMAKLIKQFSGEWEMTALGTFVKSRTVRGMVKPAAQSL